MALCHCAVSGKVRPVPHGGRTKHCTSLAKRGLYAPSAPLPRETPHRRAKCSTCPRGTDAAVRPGGQWPSAAPATPHKNITKRLCGPSVGHVVIVVVACYILKLLTRTRPFLNDIVVHVRAHSNGTLVAREGQGESAPHVDTRAANCELQTFFQ